MNRSPLYLLSDGGELQIGNHCFFNHNCSITSMKKVVIGNDCTFGNNVVIVDHDHNFKDEANEKYLMGDVIIEDGVWVGANVVILRNTHIGKGAVVAAGSIVKGTIPAKTVYKISKNSDVTQL